VNNWPATTTVSSAWPQPPRWKVVVGGAYGCLHVNHETRIVAIIPSIEQFMCRDCGRLIERVRDMGKREWPEFR
jgi:hypothetical protein